MGHILNEFMGFNITQIIKHSQLNMTNKKFEAILAKNEIAREIKSSRRHNTQASTSYILSMLFDIEAYIGEGNQPSIRDIINSELDI